MRKRLVRRLQHQHPRQHSATIPKTTANYPHGSAHHFPYYFYLSYDFQLLDFVFAKACVIFPPTRELFQQCSVFSVMCCAVSFKN